MKMKNKFWLLGLVLIITLSVIGQPASANFSSSNYVDFNAQSNPSHKPDIYHPDQKVQPNPESIDPIEIGKFYQHFSYYFHHQVS
jgi:hypothetical protein